MVAVLYDSQEILADFAKRKNITFPMLSDPHSKIIRDFKVLNTAVPPDHLWYGVPYPGTLIVDKNGTVRSKYFESRYQERFAAPTILLREFGSLAGTREMSVATPHLEAKYYATRDVVRPSLRFTLVADLQLGPKMHVYAPGVQNYIPIAFELDLSPYYQAHPVEYPKAETLYLEAIQEIVPVYQGKFRITEDVTMAGAAALEPVLSGSGQVKVQGRLKYQACDDKICYLPQNLPLEWLVNVAPQDRQRVPEPIQHRPPAPAAKK